MEKNKLISIVAIVVGALALGYFFLFAAPERQAVPEQFTVPLESGSGATAEVLYSQGFIKSETGLRLALQMKGKSPGDIESGAYRISKSMNAFEVANVLGGEPYMKWVSIPEGYRKEQIAQILARELGWSESQKEAWITEHTAPDLAHTEGVYFPDTYLIPVDESPAEVAERMRARFEEAFAPYAEEALRQNIRWPVVLNIAGLVQRESPIEDMPLIAGIIWNRLEIGMKLDIDATLQYIKGTHHEDLWWPPVKPEDKELDSPFNTYTNNGLPPHPIANPGVDAIEAVLNPAETNCLFYLHDDEANTHCAATYDEHLDNVEQYLR